MTWLTENWFWILTLIAFVAMHLFGHGGHGGHGGASRHRNADATKSGTAQGGTGDTRAGGHRH